MHVLKERLSFPTDARHSILYDTTQTTKRQEVLRAKLAQKLLEAETVETKHELEKTTAQNLCSGIQDTGKSVILDASKPWQLA